MKTIVLVKQVPSLGAVEFDEETKTLKREGVPLELNVFDRYAVQHAALLGDEVVAMTMGPPQAEEALRECLAVGADRAIHLSDRAFAVADTIGTSRTLALAIQKEGADLVLCGRKTLDSETWQVPPEVAAFLGWPHVTNAAALEASDAGLSIARETDFGDETYEAAAPLVVSVGRPPAAEPDPGSRDGPITVWTARDLVDDFHEGDKRFGQDGSPTRVLAVRDSRPERKGLRFEDVAAAAQAILNLLAERRAEPDPWEKPGHIAEIAGAHYDCWSVVELAAGRPRRISLELVSRSRNLAGKLGGKQVSLVFGIGAEAAADEVGRHGAELVYTAESLGEYHPELWAHAVRVVLERERPHVLLIPATGRGRDYGPRAAGDLELGMTGDCVGVDIARAGRLLQQKPAYGGNIVSVIMGATTPQLATVRPRMYEPLEPRDDAEFEVRTLDLGALPEPRVRLVDRHELRRSYEIDDADIVSLLGPGLGWPEAIPRIEAEATALGAAVAGTRGACEAGWLERTRQVGLLGRPVAPRLLVAVGVHGDVEELGGFVKARVVVTVGAEADAPIREAADVILEGDWRQTLEPLHRAVAAGL
ncbi:MAG TPA: FAD-binding protein [Gaiellaceae bacterium]|nr:FAD-binding protein [Gaiellaceae bacterium]